MATKRGRGKDDNEDNGVRESCFFGAKCYRRNSDHFKEYSHPHLEALTSEPNCDDDQIFRDQWKILKNLGLLKASSSSSDSCPASQPKGAPPKLHPLVRKLEAAKPYSVFLTKVRDIKSTHQSPASIYLTDLLNAAHGNLKCTLQINFLVEWEWLKMNYEATGNQNIPLLILYGNENPELAKLKADNVKAVRIRSPYPFGTHHSKIMVLVYSDESVRVVVSTANLVPSDWENRIQGLWISPKCPKGQGDSPTGFKSSLLRYLDFYQVSQLQSYTDAIKACDFSTVNAFFVASVPGSHQGSALCNWGHMAVASIHRKHSKPSTWPLIMQCSSIGSLGGNPGAWAMSELANSLGPMNKDVKVIFPSKKNVMDSLDGILGGQCLPYNRQTHIKQEWLRDYLYQWKSDKWQRTRAIPHIKTYAQVSGSEAAFLLLTSSNLSKAAWGSLNKARGKLYIMSYEAGVLLLPKFVNGKESFDLSGEELILPYDLPETKYDNTDTPWFWNYLNE